MRTRGGAVDIEDLSGWQSVVRCEIIYAPARHMPRLRNLVVSYLPKTGGKHFDAQGPADPDTFLDRLQGDPHAFAIVLSPDPHAGTSLSLEDYARTWMAEVSRQLGYPLDWIAAVHTDEPDHPHIHVVIRGTIRIALTYLQHGMRVAANEVLSWYVGPASARGYHPTRASETLVAAAERQ
jgi:type IV secretory pathway VirD2 relaxase